MGCRRCQKSIAEADIIAPIYVNCCDFMPQRLSQFVEHNFDRHRGKDFSAYFRLHCDLCNFPLFKVFVCVLLFPVSRSAKIFPAQIGHLMFTRFPLHLKHLVSAVMQSLWPEVCLKSPF